jgi:hypothetical protein
MLRRILTIAAFVAIALPVQAQTKISADDLHGHWQLVVNLDEELDQAENAIERMALKAVGGLLDEIDIRLLFEEGGVARIGVEAFGSEAEVDEDDISWEITRHGGLVFGESERFDSGEDTIFFREGDLLIAYEQNKDGKPGARKNLSLHRIDS